MTGTPCLQTASRCPDSPAYSMKLLTCKNIGTLGVLSVSDSDKYILTNSAWQYLLKYILEHV